MTDHRKVFSILFQKPKIFGQKKNKKGKQTEEKEVFKTRKDDFRLLKKG